MYTLIIALLLFVLPVASIGVEAAQGPIDLVAASLQWFTFWAAGVRLFLAGFRQAMKPEYTAGTFFEVSDAKAFPIVREVGFGNLSMGTLGLCSLFVPEFRAAAALAGGLYYGLAAIGHSMRAHRGWNSQVAWRPTPRSPSFSCSA